MNLAIRNKLLEGLQALELDLNAQQIEQSLQFIQLLQQWNQAYNLTAIRDPEDMVIKHLLDSYAILPFISGQYLLDVGCGPGLPGIPLAIARPDLNCDLLDSNNKKIAFVTHCSQQLKLDNVNAIHQRVELHQSIHTYDIITSRAFSTLADMVSKTEHLCCNSSKIIAMKARISSQELDEIPQHYVYQCYPLYVPGLDAERHVVSMSMRDENG